MFKRTLIGFFAFSMYLGLVGQTGSLQVTGLLRDGWKPIKGCVIQLYSQGALLMIQVTDVRGKFNFTLELNREYQMVFTAYKYVTKTVSINTKVEEFEIQDWSFWFNLDLFPEIPGIDYTLFQIPIAKIFYNPTWREFDYDISYSEKIKKLGDKTLEMVKKERGKHYLYLAAEAEKEFRQKNFIGAMDNLLYAGVCDPYNPYPAEQLQTVFRTMLRTNSQLKRFLLLHELGDSCLREHAFNKATVFFSEALFLFPKSDFTQFKSRLADTLSQRFDNSLYRARRFEYYVAIADKYIGQKDYLNALYYYQLAGDIFPMDEYVFKQKRFILSDIAQTNITNPVLEFRKLVESADKHFSNSNWDLAEKQYLQARALNPNDQYVAIQLEKIQRKKTLFKPFSFTPESRDKKFINDLLGTYDKGITQEIHEWEGKQVLRIIINDGKSAWEYLQIKSKTDTVYYRNGQPITKQVFKTETGY